MHPKPSADLPSQATQVARERARDRGRATARDRPVGHMARQREQEPHRSREELVEGQDRMRGTAREERAGLRVAEQATRQKARAPQRTQAEAREQKRSPRKAERREQIRQELLRLAQKRREQAPVGSLV